MFSHCPHRGNSVTKQRLSHWAVEAIALAYTNQSLQPPEGQRAHLTQWLGLQDICAAASCTLELTFFQFYMLEVWLP